MSRWGWVITETVYLKGWVILLFTIPSIIVLAGSRAPLDAWVGLFILLGLLFLLATLVVAVWEAWRERRARR